MRRMTNQKKLLYEEVKNFTTFFDAYELHEKITQKNGDVGLATIYRFLNRLEQEGDIHSFLCNNKKIYSLDKTNHVHFTCEKCGGVKHLTIKNVDFLKEITKEKVCHFQIELTGTCDSCKAKDNHPHR